MAQLEALFAYGFQMEGACCNRNFIITKGNFGCFYECSQSCCWLLFVRFWLSFLLLSLMMSAALVDYLGTGMPSVDELCYLFFNSG